MSRVEIAGTGITTNTDFGEIERVVEKEIENNSLLKESLDRLLNPYFLSFLKAANNLAISHKLKLPIDKKEGFFEWEADGQADSKWKLRLYVDRIKIGSSRVLKRFEAQFASWSGKEAGMKILFNRDGISSVILTFTEDSKSLINKLTRNSSNLKRLLIFPPNVIADLVECRVNLEELRVGAQVNETSSYFKIPVIGGLARIVDFQVEFRIAHVWNPRLGVFTLSFDKRGTSRVVRSILEESKEFKVMPLDTFVNAVSDMLSMIPRTSV